ncbi:MAG: hypothetical protein ACNI27_15300 [Desulfovibrio sp.]
MQISSSDYISLTGTAVIDATSSQGARPATSTFSLDGSSTQRQPLSEEEQKQQKGELERKAAMSYLRLYVETHGAPEEKNQVITSRVGEKEEDEKKKKRTGADDQVMETLSKVLEDPAKPNDLNVVISRYEQPQNESGKNGEVKTSAPEKGDGSSGVSNKKTISRTITIKDRSEPDQLQIARQKAAQLYKASLEGDIDGYNQNRMIGQAGVNGYGQMAGMQAGGSPNSGSGYENARKGAM